MVEYQSKVETPEGVREKYGWCLQFDPRKAGQSIANWLSHGGVGRRRVDVFLGTQHLLLYDWTGKPSRNLLGLTPEEGRVVVRIEEIGRNTGKHWHWWYSGSTADMVPSLIAIFYELNSDCAEPPADYGFAEPSHRQQVLAKNAAQRPLRDAVQAVLEQHAASVPDFFGVLTYDQLGLSQWIATPVQAGIRDPGVIRQGFILDQSKLAEVCEYVVGLGVSFEEAKQALCG